MVIISHLLIELFLRFLPEWRPILSLSLEELRCGIEKSLTDTKRCNDSRATSLAWRSPFLSGNPEATMYASPIVSTLYTSYLAMIPSNMLKQNVIEYLVIYTHLIYAILLYAHHQCTHCYLTWLYCLVTIAPTDTVCVSTN